jgi:hypothetical protein
MLHDLLKRTKQEEKKLTNKKLKSLNKESQLNAPVN